MAKKKDMKLQKALEENIKLAQENMILRIRLDDTMGALMAKNTGGDSELEAFADNAYNLAEAVHVFLGSDDEDCFEKLHNAIVNFDQQDPFNLEKIIVE